MKKPYGQLNDSPHMSTNRGCGTPFCGAAAAAKPQIITASIWYSASTFYQHLKIRMA